MSEHDKALVRRYYVTVLNDKNIAALDDLFATTFV